MKKIKVYLSALLMGLTVSSCNDYLTLMPLNEIVMENFWTNKDDVESVLLGAYASLESKDCVVRMSIWGEMRSDNITAGKSPDDDILQILRDNILATNQWTKYKCFYEAINNANTVLYFAPGVNEIDPNYTRGQYEADRAEAIAIRSLCYWYLIRAYKDVPYTTEPSIDDTKDFFVGQTPFDSILNCLIRDLEGIKDKTKEKYLKDLENTSRFTRTAVYSMLADMYLEKGEWDKCIECCEVVNEIKMDEYKDLLDEEGNACTVTLFNNYPLFKEDYQSMKGTVVGNAYNEIFGKGNTFEIIFELPFDNKKKNPLVDDYYSKKELDGGKLKATNEACKDAYTQLYDVRFYENIRGGSDEGYIVKYAYQEVAADLSGGSAISTTNSQGEFSASGRESTSPNWIIYRYSDVLLMEAEAKIMKAKDLGGNDSLPAAVVTLFNEAFQLIDAVNQRALGGYAGADRLDFTSYNSNADDMEVLVLDERRRELMFEGKRWFDLARKSRRDGNTKYLWEKIEPKFDSNSRSAVRIKMTDPDAVYFPFNRDEIKINTKLKQNPVYVEDEFIQKAQ